VNAAAAELHADGVHLERWLDSTSMVTMPERPRPRSVKREVNLAVETAETCD